MEITTKKIIKTAILPGILPRLKILFGSGYLNFAYLVALIYNLVRILPSYHPYLKKEYIGSYSTKKVISEAANHLKPSVNNIDQIIIFFSVIAAIIIFLLQCIIAFVTIFITAAQAQVAMPENIEGFFQTPNPSEDIAYRMMDLVFGVPDLFNSKSLTENNLHSALHDMFEFYSYGLLVIGSIIIIYYIIAVVAETAQSGVPFGQRFNKTWAPLRLVLFFALLLPLTHGLNGAQYITLNVAKLGSDLASTGWLKYNEAIDETLTGNPRVNVATPTAPNLTEIPAFMMIAKTCQIGYQKIFHEDEYEIKSWAVYKKKPVIDDDEAAVEDISDYVAVEMQTTQFQELASLAGSPNISIVFGIQDKISFPNHEAGVFPLCGKISMTITDVSQPGSAIIHTAYYQLIEDLWAGDLNDIGKYADNITKRTMNIDNDRDSTAELPTDSYRDEWAVYLNDYMNNEEKGIIAKAVKEQIENGDWVFSEKLRDFGWGGAAIWYNKIAEQNGAVVAALYHLPITVAYPHVMERARKLSERENEYVAEPEVYAVITGKSSARLQEILIGEREVLTALNLAYRFWDGSEDLAATYFTGNPIIDAINLVLGTDKLFQMCANADVHPLAQLSSVGKAMIENAIRSYIGAGIFSIASIIPNPFSGAAASIAKFFSTIASIGLLVGFILFYILPFMPFLYFFFAVGGWVKGIFEAMVAMPLWALAHLRIDGDSIPGEAALQGYYLIFEIFIRPILIVFGLIAAITIFTAMVKVLNDIFYLALANLSGHEYETGTVCFVDPAIATLKETAPEEVVNEHLKDIGMAKRGPIDEFFFTILYAIIVYMTGTTCFKLIDRIPNDILRWINAEVSSFNDKAADPAEGLVKYISLAGSQLGSVGNSVGGVATGLGQSVRQGLSFLNAK